jgi:hypothetical protein
VVKVGSLGSRSSGGIELFSYGVAVVGSWPSLVPSSRLGRVARALTVIAEADSPISGGLELFSRSNAATGCWISLARASAPAGVARALSASGLEGRGRGAEDGSLLRKGPRSKPWKDFLKFCVDIASRWLGREDKCTLAAVMVKKWRYSAHFLVG